MNAFYRTSGWLAAAAIAAVAFAPEAFAQPRRGADRDMEPVWTLHAQAVAADLKLDDAKTQAVVDSYVTSRKNLAAAAEQATGEGRARFQAMMESAESERAALREALEKTLPEDQAGKAMNSLGSFSRQADRMVAAIDEMDLEPEAQQEALMLISGYAAETNAMRAKATSREDWQGIRTAMQDAKTKLDTAMADVLDDAQLSAWNEKTAWRGRGGGRGDRSRERDGRSGGRQTQE